jgi:hypothetical protein
MSVRIAARYHDRAAKEYIGCTMLARLAIALAALASGTAAVGGADADILRATLQCERVAAPGRVRCDAELRTSRGTVRWADVEILETPDFLAPLKGRVGPRDAAMRENDLWRWGLGLVARDRGDGDVVTRVRAVVCDGDRCEPYEATARNHVTVGP